MTLQKPQPNRGKLLAAPPAVEDWRRRNPVFSLQYTVPGYCVQDCNQEERAAFALTLIQLGKRKWLEILQSDRHGSGSEKIPRRQMRVAIPQHISEDQEFFTVVRFCGMMPMIGYVHQGVYYIIWLDRTHNCY